MMRLDSTGDMVAAGEEWYPKTETARQLLVQAADRPPEPISLAQILHQHPHLALAGAPGSGKSTLLQYESALSSRGAAVPVEENNLIAARQFFPCRGG